MSKAYQVYNQNSQVIQESSNVVINDTGYDQDIIDNQILTQESIGDNPKVLESLKITIMISLKEILTLPMMKLYL